MPLRGPIVTVASKLDSVMSGSGGALGIFILVFPRPMRSLRNFGNFERYFESRAKPVLKSFGCALSRARRRWYAACSRRAT